MSLKEEVFNRVNLLLNNSDNWTASRVSELSGNLFWIKEKDTGVQIWVSSGFWFCDFHDDSRCLGSFGFFDKIRLWPKVHRIAANLLNKKQKELFPTF